MDPNPNRISNENPLTSKTAQRALKRELMLRDLSPKQRKALNIVEQSNELLKTTPAVVDIAQNNLKMALNQHNTDLSMQTCEILDELSFCEEKALKKLYNYMLSTLRQNRELAEDVL